MADRSGPPAAADGRDAHQTRPNLSVRAGVVRLLDATGAVVGAGWRISPRVVATCAHVVAAAVAGSAYGDAPVARVRLDFPFEPQVGQSWATTAEVYRWEPIRPDGSGDVALLRLTNLDEVPAAAPAPVLRASDGLWAHPFQVLGFPTETPGGEDGIWTGGHLRGQQGTGLCQLQTGVDQMAVGPGFSGAPVWADGGRAVVGLAVAADSQAGSHTAHLLPIEAVLAADLDLLPCPYRGLTPLQEYDAALLHGRDVEVQTVLDELVARLLVVVVGRSGVGKSSLVRAGVVPKVRDRGTVVRVHRVTANSTPQEVIAEPVGAEEVYTQARGEDRNRVKDGTGAPAEPGDLLVVLDQFEELVSVDAPRAVELLRQWISFAESRPGSRLLATLGVDSLAALTTPELSWRLSEGTVFLPPMNREQLRRAIVAPTEFAPGLEFEPGLVDRILDDAGDEPGRLPLVGALMRGLWDRRVGGLLTRQAYGKIGGVGGAIAQLADDAIRDFNAEDLAAVRRLFGHLVALDPGQPHFRRVAVPYAALPEADRSLTPALVSARLLVLGGREGAETVEIAHQALVDGWTELKHWLHQDRAFLSWQAQAAEKQRRWHEADEDDGGLLRGKALDEAEFWTGSRHEQIAEAVARYITMSRGRRRRERRRRRVAIASLTVLAVLVTSLGVLNRQREDRIAAESAAARAAALGQAALDRSTTEPVTATQLALSAARADPHDTKAHAALLDRYAAQRSVEQTLPRVTAGVVRSLESSLDGHVLAAVSVGGTTVLSESPDGRDSDRWVVPEPADSAFELSPDGRWGSSISPQGDVAVWDLQQRTRRPLGKIVPVDPASVLVAFSADGSHLAVVIGNRSEVATNALVWGVRSGPPVELRAPESRYPSGTVFTDLWVADDGRTVQVATERPDSARATTIPSLDTWAPATQGRADPASSIAAASVRSADGTSTSTCLGPPAPPEEGRRAAAVRSELMPTGLPGSRVEVATSADSRSVRSIPLPTHASCWNTARTTDGDHLLVPGRGVDGHPSPHFVVISMRTGRAYGITLPSGPGTRGAAELAGFSSTEPLINAVEAPDGSLTVHVARGDSIYQLRGRFDWLSTLPSRESGPMTTDDGRFTVTRGALADKLIVHDTSDGREVAQLGAADLGRSTLGGMEGSATGQALTELLGESVLRTDEFGVVGQVLTQVHSDAGVYHYVERRLPDLHILANFALPSARNSAYRAETITAEDRVFALVGGDTTSDQLMLSVFDRRTQEMVGDPVEVGEAVHSVAGAKRRQLVMRQNPADPDKLLLADSAGNLALWSVSGEAKMADIELPLLQSASGSPVAFDPQGQRVVALDASGALHVLDSGSLAELVEPIPLRGVEEVAGVTADGFVMAVQSAPGTATSTVQFWNPESGSLSGSLPVDDLDAVRLRASDQVATVVRSAAAPEELATDEKGWFKALCATDARPMTADEAAITPPGASTNPCALQ